MHTVNVKDIVGSDDKMLLIMLNFIQLSFLVIGRVSNKLLRDRNRVQFAAGVAFEVYMYLILC